MHIQFRRLRCCTLVCLSMSVLTMNAPRASLAQTQTRSQQSARRFNVILRVVRPRWRDTFAIPAPVHPHVLSGDKFTINHADSDAEFLKELRVNNEYFTFDGVVSKRVLTLRGDQGWQAPADFTYQTLWLGVVDNDREMLRVRMTEPKMAQDQQGKQGSPNHSFVRIGPLPAFKSDLTEKIRQELLQKNMFLVSYRLTQFYARSGGLIQYHDNDLLQSVNNGETFCMGGVLPVINAKGNSLFGSAPDEILPPTDIIFATVTEIR